MRNRGGMEKRMDRKAASGIMLTLLLTSMLTLAFNIQSVRAEEGTIYIRADGSVDPPTANITSVNNITYTFTSHIYDSIVVERDNIVVDGAGYTAQGTGSGTGIYLSYRGNVTVKNTTITLFQTGIDLEVSSGNTLSGNTITINDVGVSLSTSSNNTFSGNNIRNNNYAGIRLNVSSNNEIYHNNFINNTLQALILASGANSWDNGYIGNYWSDYTGRDTDGDFTGETPYIIDEDNKDNHPLMFPSPLPIGCEFWDYVEPICLPPCIHGNIITYVNDVSRHIMYYNISTGEFTDTKWGFFHSLYENFIVSLDPRILILDIYLGLSLYDISTGSIRSLPLPPHTYDIGDVNKWKLWPRSVVSMYGDIMALRDSYGVWVYNITTSSIIAHPTTAPCAGVSVYENIIAFTDGFIGYHDLSTNTTTNTGEAGMYPSVYGNIIAFQDGLTIKHYNMSSGQVTIVGVGEVPSLHGNIIVFSTDESSVGADLNDDGDVEDMVIRYYDILTHTTTNTGKIGEYPSIYESTIAFSIYEPMVDTDLNCDGDRNDYVIRYLPADTAVINVTTSTTVVVESCSVSINATVENQGTITETFNVTAYYNTTPINTTEVTLTSGNIVTITFTWNTTGVEEGDYAISAKASVDPGETDTTDNTKVDGTITVLSPGHDVAIKDVSPSKTFVGENCSLSILITAKNYGNFTETFNVTAYYDDTPTETKTATNLPSGEETTLTFTWNTTGVAKGNYTIKAYADPVPGETDITDNTITDGWVVVTIFGDVNGDGVVDIGDMLMVKLAYSGVIIEPSADLNCDGVVDIGDVKLVKLAYSGIL